MIMQGIKYFFFSIMYNMFAYLSRATEDKKEHAMEHDIILARKNKDKFRRPRKAL